MDAKWTVYAKKADFVGIGKKYNIDQVVARVIRNRDVIYDKDIDMYLNGTLDCTHDPSLMADMDKACQIIKQKIEEKKHIRIISDYDVDGVMSNYILLKGLQEAGAVVTYEIPDRMLDGYGINERMVVEAIDEGVDTIITCDNGIAAFGALALAKENGLTVVVTDHHEVPYEIVDGEKRYKSVPADAIVDNKREDCKYPYKGLCGAGVAYKFIRNLYNTMNIAWEDKDKYLDMLAIATVCDVMDLTDENRIYVKEGMRVIKNTKNVGLKALLAVNDLIGKDIKSFQLGFVIGPCINATGRLDNAKYGLDLLLLEDEKEALARAANIKEINISRKKMTEDGEKEASVQVEEKLTKDNVLVVFLPTLHESLAGIVAGRIRETYYKPTLVVTRSENGILKGSARSIEGYNMFDALTECADVLEKFGGHELAAGFSLREENLEKFRRMLNEKQKLTKEDLTPIVRIDVPMPFYYITEKLVNDLSKLEPFGKGNEKPIFAQSRLKVKRVKRLGAEGQYVKITFEDESKNQIEAMEFKGNMFFDCIKMWFSEAECDRMERGFSENVYLDVAYYPDVNEFAGRRTIQIKPIKYRKSDMN